MDIDSLSFLLVMKHTENVSVEALPCSSVYVLSDHSNLTDYVS